MGYYRMLAVVFVILIMSVFVQGSELFKDTFFVIAYAIMGLVLFIGTKYKKSSETAMAIGFILIFSIGFLSTLALVEFFTAAPAVSTVFKLAISFSLDACALFFLNYGKRMRGDEGKDRGLGQYRMMKRIREQE